MKRRELLLAGAAAAVGVSAFPFGWIAGAEKNNQKLLYFTRSAGYEHPPIKRIGNDLAPSEKMLTEWGRKAGLEVVCSKDGALFDRDIDQYDGFVFYTSGVLTADAPSQPGKPMSAAGKKKLLAAIDGGRSFVGIHSATDCFHSAGIDPYLAMVGGEFVVHGAQQNSPMKVTTPNFPGMEGLGDQVSLFEEWYALKNFGKDLHVLLVQETAKMQGPMYQRPPFPATWARTQGKGRVFYTSMGHDQTWSTPTFRQVLMGGIAWALETRAAT